MKKMLVLGNFCFGSESFNGHTSKSRDYLHYISQKYGSESLEIIDTKNFRKNFISSYFKLKKLLKKVDAVILLLGLNAAKLLIPIILKSKKKYKFKVFWSLVGGGLLYDDSAHNKLCPMLKDIDALFCETKALTVHFSEYVPKTYYTPVFTQRKLSKPFSPVKNDGVLKFCTYSRVCKEKGITLAVEAVKEINGQGVKCTLDIFGEPQPEYAKELNSILQNTEDYITLNDYLSGEGVIDKLSEFDAMLFPTYYPGEGFPIGVVECFKAGVPVIASDWHFNSEIIENGSTGFIFDLSNFDELIDCIKRLLDDRDLALDMRVNAYKYSCEFEPEQVLSKLFEEIDGQIYNN